MQDDEMVGGHAHARTMNVQRTSSTSTALRHPEVRASSASLEGYWHGARNSSFEAVATAPQDDDRDFLGFDRMAPALASNSFTRPGSMNS